MRISAKLGLTGLLAAMLFAAAISTASARNLEVNPNQGFLVSWSRLEFQSSAATVRCQVTLDGSFHSRTIAKTPRLLIGHISAAMILRERCTGGEALIITSTLPWHVTYEGFTGALPNITSVQLLLARALFRITVLGVINCFYGTATDNITGSAAIEVGATRAITELTPVGGRNTANLLEGRIEFCPLSGTLVSAAGDGKVTLLNRPATPVTIRLI